MTSLFLINSDYDPSEHCYDRAAIYAGFALLAMVLGILFFV